jgi:transposase
MDNKHDARKLDALAKEDLRRRVVHAVINEGMSISKAASVFGVSRTSVHAWLDLYRKEGEEGLVPKRPGRPKGGGYLKGWQAGVIVNIIKDRTPDQLKLPFALWTREAVRDLIYDKFGVWYAVRSVGDLLDRWGFTAQKPQRRASERDDARIRRWLAEVYPKLRRRAKRENAEIYWEDETGLRSDHFVGRSYAPRGRTPTVEATGRRFGCNIISAVSNKGTLRFRVFEGGFNQEVMIDFLARLVRDAERKVIVIADGHPAHKGAKLKRWLAAHAEECELVLLPPYAPELNPDEVLNQDLKANVFSSGRPATKRQMIRQTRSYLASTQKRPYVVKFFFKETYVAYAAA